MEQGRLRFEGRWVADVASPLGAQYLHDDSGDELAHDTKEAVAVLLAERPHTWPASGTLIGAGLWGGSAPSPSLTWHAQAVGALLEMGYAPTADCVRTHLRVIAGRLDPANCTAPEHAPDEHAWRLRTRHVAWVLACLAELPADALRAGSSDALAEAVEEHRRLTLTAYEYLDGRGEPGQWIGIRRGERFWSEYEGGARRRNLLNSIYAAIAISRAERHGFSIEQRRWDGPRLDQAVYDLAEQIEMTTGVRGPRARLADTGWPEPWASQEELPVGVVGLLCIFLVEYAHLLGTTHGERAALRRWRLAERLGHELLSRRAEWRSHIDAFAATGAEGGWWFVPSFSVCVRAVLETQVAEVRDAAVAGAFDTIRGLERPVRGAVTWIDPTRDWTPEPADPETQHRWFEFDPADATTVESSTMAVHAAVMAYAALRRATLHADPRRTFERSTETRRPRSPFTLLRFAADERGLVMICHAGEDYVEYARVSVATFWLVKAMTELGVPADHATIAAEVDRLAPPTQSRLTRAASGVDQHLDDLNRRFGVRLAERDQDGLVRLTSRVELPGGLETLDGVPETP